MLQLVDVQITLEMAKNTTENHIIIIKYDESEVHENDIVVTGFILNRYEECEKRLFDVVVLKDTNF